MTRVQAALIHLGISVVILAILLAVLLLYWYPGIFFATDGGWQGLQILAGVDLTIGPLLTLIVFRHGKPGLRFDLTCIALVQALCLAGGLWVVHGQRPLAMVYVDEQFFSMSRDAYVEAGVAPPDLSALPGRGPRWVIVDLPADYTAQGEIRRQALQSGRPLRTFHEHYVPWDPTRIDCSRGHSIDDVRARDAGRGALDAWLAEHGGAAEDYAWFTYGARYAFRFAVLRRSDCTFMGLADIPAPE